MSAQPLSDYKKDISHGIWFFLHTMGEAAKTPELMRAYSVFFRNICDKMGCSCENHCIEMLGSHPPEHYFSMLDKNNVPCGCFYHSVLCHNMVNERLGKPTYNYDQVYPLYRGPDAHTTVIKPCSAPGQPDASAAASSSTSSTNGVTPVPLGQLKKLSVSGTRRRAGIRIMDA